MATEKDELEPTAEQKEEHKRREARSKKLDAKAPDPREEAPEDKQTAPAAPPEPTPKRKISPK